MKERPIPMKGPMVRAIMEGRKTQTRRVAKHPLAVAAKRIHSYRGNTEFDCVLSDETGGIIHCPYGVPGDRLWVKETWWHHQSPEIEQAGFENYTITNLNGTGSIPHYNRDFYPTHYPSIWKKKPPRFMPRWASRITLEIEAVRVERLIEITREDCIAEGVSVVGTPPSWGVEGFGRGLCWMQPEGAYRELCESINGPGSWDANPWCWCVTFRRVTP
jgi:hypothetical protein